MKIEKLRRVRKEDIDLTPPPKQDGLSVCLECWKLWMQSDDRDLSASRMKLRGRDDDELPEGYESDPYGEQRRDDMKTGGEVNTLIYDLKPAHRWAIHKACGISSVWNFPSVDFPACLAAAHVELERKLRANPDTSKKFI